MPVPTPQPPAPIFYILELILFWPLMAWDAATNYKANWRGFGWIFQWIYWVVAFAAVWSLFITGIDRIFIW